MSNNSKRLSEKESTAYKTRLGIRMFLSYLVFYVVFVAINVGQPLLMERTVCLGLNLATVYGLSLIVVALLLALVYDAKCRACEDNSETEG